jgi:hypothetical protein
MNDRHALTGKELAEVEKLVYEWGLDGWHSDEEGVDWDAVLRDIEGDDVDLGTDWSSPTIRRIKAAYRRGRRDAKEF